MAGNGAFPCRRSSPPRRGQLHAQEREEPPPPAPPGLCPAAPAGGGGGGREEERGSKLRRWGRPGRPRGGTTGARTLVSALVGLCLAVVKFFVGEEKEAMAAAPRDRRRRGRAPGAASAAAAAEDDGEEQHLNPYLSDEPPSSSRVQFRNVASRARWVEEAGEAEVVDSKGKLWLTTGVTRGGKLYYNVEEIGFLAERGALVLQDDEGGAIGMEEIYRKIAGGDYGCSWDAFQAYRHLKLLGYIVGRYGVPWTMKHSRTSEVTDSPKTMADTDRDDGACNDITKFLKEMHLDGIYPSFEVHLPNSKFKKSCPGVPTFLLCLLRDKPPSRDELETVESKFDGIPLKFCHVDNGRVSFLSFDSVTLPSLP